MRKFLIGAAIALPLSLIIVPASALPGAKHGALIGEQFSTDIIAVKGGHGHGRGHGHGWGRGHGFKPHGWRGMGCPPGHWKKGWC
jgi:hypothetical protein